MRSSKPTRVQRTPGKKDLSPGDLVFTCSYCTLYDDEMRSIGVFGQKACPVIFIEFGDFGFDGDIPGRYPLARVCTPIGVGWVFRDYVSTEPRT